MGLNEFRQLRAPTIGPGTSPDSGTVYVGYESFEIAPAPEVAFLSHHAEIHGFLTKVHGRGLAVFVVDDDGLAKSVFLPARPDAPTCATLGRHTHAPLSVGQDDPALGLRHLAIIVPASREGEPLRWRVVDLRAGAGMYDEGGQRIPGFEADGPAFFSVRRLRVLVFTCDGSGRGVPGPPLRAWANLPPRRVVPQAAHRPAPARRSRVIDPEITAVVLFDAPQYAGMAVSGPPIGRLHVTSEGRSASLPVDAGAARAGVLLGRYDRCDHAGQPVLRHENISRVHALVLELDGQVYAFDLGSTNGTWFNGARADQRALRGGDQVALGKHLAEVRWFPA